MAPGGYHRQGKGRRGLNRRTSASRLHSVEQLPVISEGPDTSIPVIPEKSYARRSAAARDSTQFPYPGSPPPAYREHTPSSSEPSTSARSCDVGPQEPLPVDKRPSWMVARGGWWKIVLGLLLGVACVVALAVGLTLGLRKNNSATSDNGSNNGGNTVPVFPTGSYAFNTALHNISTACTTNPSTFRCYPYTTFAQSNSSSKAVFFWTITPNEGNAYSLYRISAAPNPFVPQFDNVDMQLLSQGQDDERLVFRFTMNAAIVPSPPLQGVGNSAVMCYYNGTVMGASIYTRRRASYPVGLSTPVTNTNGGGGGGSGSFDAWPYAVDVRQVATAGAGVPDCRDAQGRPVGSFAVIEQTGSNTQSSPPSSCSCSYQNYDL